jgi:hypothetical protein
MLRWWVSAENLEVALVRKVDAKLSLPRGRPRRRVPVVSSGLGLPLEDSRSRADWRACRSEGWRRGRGEEPVVDVRMSVLL